MALVLRWVRRMKKRWILIAATMWVGCGSSAGDPTGEPTADENEAGAFVPAADPIDSGRASADPVDSGSASADTGTPAEEVAPESDTGAPSPIDSGTAPAIDSGSTPLVDSGTKPDTATPAVDSAKTPAVDSAKPDTAVADTAVGDTSTKAPTYVTHEITFYGWPDNDPPGPAIAYPGLHKQAGGVGTYEDPVTFATDQTEFAPGTKLYIPMIKKYVIMEDYCAACISDWKAGKRHIDIWMNSNAANTTKLLACQYGWTRPAADVEINPPPGRPVNATPLFEPATGVCLTAP